MVAAWFLLMFGFASFQSSYVRGSEDSTRYLISVHQTVSQSCDLSQPAYVHDQHGYFIVMLEDGSEPIYSPDLSSSDFLSISTDTPDDVIKDIRKSGFHVRPVQGPVATRVPAVAGGGCPSLQEADTESAQQRFVRRRLVQSHVYTVGRDVQPPVPTREPKPTVAQGTSPGKGRIANVIASVIVGTDGAVQNAAIIRGLNATLDQKALDAVRQWKFQPARKYGLSVPVKITMAVTFAME
jgi:TonB family protein